MLPKNLKPVSVALTTLFTLGLMLVLFPGPVLSQQDDNPSRIQDLVVNGGFEGGFQQDFGVG